MKKALVAAIGLTAMGIAPTMAADLAARPYTKAPAVATPIYDWGGMYVGINAGGSWNQGCWDLINVGGVAATPTQFVGCQNISGGAVGGQAGYRWQASNWVFGLEAQGNWADMSGSQPSQAA